MIHNKRVAPLFVSFLLYAGIIQAQHKENTVMTPSQPSSIPNAGEEKTNEVAEAKRLFNQGLRLMAEERWKEAEQFFRRSNQEVSRPSNMFNIALCLVRQSQIVEGLEILSQLENDGDSLRDSALRQRIEGTKTELKSMIGVLEIEVNPESASITIDKKPTSQAGPKRFYNLNPGNHAVIVRQEGFTDIRLDVLIDSGKKHRASVLLSPVTPEPPIDDSTQITATNRSDVAATESQLAEADRSYGASPWPWITAGFGGALLVSAGVLALLANAENDKILDECPEDTICSNSDKPELDKLVESRDSLFLASDITFIVGIISVGTGVALWLFDEDDDPVVQGTAKLGRRHVELRLVGRF